MNSSAPHLEFAPPRTGGSLRALGLAVIAHVVLLAVLTMGVQWKSDPVQQAFEAELWSSVPTEAAPPPPPPEPEVKPEPPKPVEPDVKPIPVARPDAIVKAEAEIAMAKEKEKERAKERKRLEQDKLEQEKQLKAEAEKEKQDRLKKEQAEKDKKDKLDKQAKLDQQKKQAQQDQANAAKDRADQMKRMEKLAGAGNGAPNSNGAAAQSSGPSASYAGRIVARIKPNITYPDDVTGNPRTEVEIRVAPNGSILSRRITQGSGIKSWDEAVLRAIDKTETLPRDADGTVQPIVVMGFRPKD